MQINFIIVTLVTMLKRLKCIKYFYEDENVFKKQS